MPETKNRRSIFYLWIFVSHVNLTILEIFRKLNILSDLEAKPPIFVRKDKLLAPRHVAARGRSSLPRTNYNHRLIIAEISSICITGDTGGKVAGIVSPVLGVDNAPDSEPRARLHQQLRQPDPLRVSQRKLSQGLPQDHLLQVPDGPAQPARRAHQDDEGRQLRRHIIGQWVTPRNRISPPPLLPHFDTYANDEFVLIERASSSSPSLTERAVACGDRMRF